MGDSTLVLSHHWQAGSELSYVIRTLAGAVSRRGPVHVVVPGLEEGVRADGAFDLKPTWPSSVPAGAPVIVDELRPGDEQMLGRLEGSGRLFAVDSTGELLGTTGGERLTLVPNSAAPGAELGLHVPVNPLAATHRHNGLGFVDYVLILSGRTESQSEPPAEAAWLTAALPSADVVVVERAEATVWRGRARRGVVGVDSRTDLWRLMAHASVCVDLAPGAFIARECVESLLFGTPIIVPGQAAAAAAHAQSGAGLMFDTMAELIDAVTRVGDPDRRRALSEAGLTYAQPLYGDPPAFVAKVAQALRG